MAYIFFLTTLVCAVSLNVVEACQSNKGGTGALVRSTPQKKDFSDQLMKCLKEKGLDDKKAIEGIQSADLKCIVKYAWTQDDCSARQFLKAAKDYKDVYSYVEPVKSKVNIDKSCREGANGTKGFFLTLWFCLEHCENQCKGSAQAGVYPVGNVNCQLAPGSGQGCNEKRVCSCTVNNKKCGEEKTIKFGDMLDAYKKSCLNCNQNVYTAPDPKQPLNVCVKGTEEKEYMKSPKSAFAKFKAFQASSG